MRQRWPSKVDHYYWLTAYLAAHDMQKSACRVVAARKPANQVGVAAVSASTRCAACGDDRRLIVAEAAGHVPSVTEKRWIIALIHQTCVNRCRTVSFTLRNPGEKRHCDE